MNDSEEDSKIKAELDEILVKIDHIIEKIESSLPHETTDSVQEE
jgi:hypothetical protein